MQAPSIGGRQFQGLSVGLAVLIACGVASAQPQSKNQQKCVNTMNKDGAKVAATQGKENTACIKNAGGGKESDPDGCLVRDGKGKVGKAAAKVGADFAKACAAEAPDFGLPGAAAGTAAGMVTGTAAAIVNAAVEGEVQLVGDVFGDDLAGAIATDKAGAKCQATVSKDYEKTAATYMKGFLACKKDALGGADSREDLDACVLADPGSKAASTVAKLGADIGKACGENLFPGRCTGESLGALAECIHGVVRCGVCRTQIGMDGLRADCDALDDGALNQSCTVNPLAGIGPLTLLADGFVFLEGPRWKTDESALYFTDVPISLIYRLTLPASITTFRTASGGANGLAFDTQGRLVAAQGELRRVARIGANAGADTVLADRFQGARLNSPNDLIVRSDGSIYFTDPASAPALRELPFNGIFRIAPDGSLFAAAQLGQLTYPNGIELSPDESRLYVSDSVGPVRVWDVAPDGSLSGERVFATPDFGDGMAVDTAGNLYVAASTGIEVYAPDGSHWGEIPVAGTPSNCGFGGADNRTLFITTRKEIYGIDMTIPGIP